MSYRGGKLSSIAPNPAGDDPESVLLRPELDQMFECLRSRRRRLVLRLLKEGMAETTADVMVRNESNADFEEAKLVHTHLPKLEAAGYIDWDRDSGEISKGPRFDEIDPLLELFENHGEEFPSNWP